MKVSILLMSVATASALFGAAQPLSVGAGEDYGGAAAEWKPSFKARGFNLQGMRRAGPNVGFKEEHFKWMKEWGFNFVRMPLDYRCWVSEPSAKSCLYQVHTSLLLSQPRYGLARHCRFF